MQRKPDSVIHKPCGFLRDADGPMNFIRTDTILAVHHLPHGAEPFIEANMRILEYSSGLHSKLSPIMVIIALPPIMFRLPSNIAAATARACYSVGPPSSNNILSAVLGV